MSFFLLNGTVLGVTVCFAPLTNSYTQNCTVYCFCARRGRRQSRSPHMERTARKIRPAYLGEGASQRSATPASVKTTPFTSAFALQSCSRSCSPAPDLVLRKLILPRVFFSEGVFSFHRHRYRSRLSFRDHPSYIYIYIHIHIYTYIYRERER